MRIDIPREKKHVHTIHIPMRWGDMDAMGHMNNAVYFRIMETARIAWLDNLGYTLDPSGQGIVMVNALCNFQRQLTYPCDIVTHTYISSPGRSSFETWHVLERADQPGVVHASGGATICWVDFAAQKSVPLPEWLRVLLAQD